LPPPFHQQQQQQPAPQLSAGRHQSEHKRVASFLICTIFFTSSLSETNCSSKKSSVKLKSDSMLSLCSALLWFRFRRQTGCHDYEQFNLFLLLLLLAKNIHTQSAEQ